MTGKELLYLVADSLKGFQFRGNIKITMLIPPDVKRNDPYMIAGYQVAVILLVIQCKSKNAIHLLQKRRALVMV